jgi:hypothetical protein
MNYPDDNPKTIHGAAKPPLHLVPAAGVIHEAAAFADGAAKYGPYNWRERRVSTTTYIAAAKRHLEAWFNGEEYDPVSVVHHLGHARACLGIILDAQCAGMLNDDRPPKAPIADLMRTLTRAIEAPPETSGPTQSVSVCFGSFSASSGQWYANMSLSLVATPQEQYDYMVERNLLCPDCLRSPSGCVCVTAEEAPVEEDLDPLCPICPGGAGKAHALWCGGVA